MKLQSASKTENNEKQKVRFLFIERKDIDKLPIEEAIFFFVWNNNNITINCFRFMNNMKLKLRQMFISSKSK